MPLEIASPGDLARLLRGQDVRGLASLQVAGLARFDAGAVIQGATQINGLPIDERLPRGKLDYVQAVADQALVAANLTDITGLLSTIAIGPGRSIELEARLAWSSTVADGQFGIFLNVDGANVELSSIASNLAGATIGHFVNIVLTLAAGVHVCKLQGQRLNGTGTITVRAGADHPAWMAIKDIGSA